jgi:hypothetical protein
VPVVNQFVVSMVVWILGMILKRIPTVPNDMIPQVLYYVSVVSAYAIEILKQLAAAPEPVASLAVYSDFRLISAEPVPPVADPFVNGSMTWIFASVWDWVGRKLIWEKLLKRGK